MRKNARRPNAENNKWTDDEVRSARLLNAGGLSGSAALQAQQTYCLVRKNGPFICDVCPPVPVIVVLVKVPEKLLLRPYVSKVRVVPLIVPFPRFPEY